MIMSMTKSQKGVTIIEVLVALAIISLVFVIFAKVFQQFSSRESLKQSTNVLVADINDVLSDVKDGVYYDQSGVECDYNLALDTFEYTAVSGTRAGENNRCLFLGKAIFLGTNPSEVGNGEEAAIDYYIYTLVGNAADRDRNRISFTAFEVDVFKDFGTPSLFDSTDKQNVSSRAAIAKTYIWRDHNENGDIDPTNSEVIYIDGFAIVYADFGVIPGAAGGVTGAARNLRLLPIYPCSGRSTSGLTTPSLPTTIDKRDGGRIRFSQADFETLTRGNAGDNCSSDTDNYYHYADDSAPSSPTATPPFNGDIVNGEIIVCLEGPAGQAYVSVGSTGVITAEPELDSQRADDKCGF